VQSSCGEIELLPLPLVLDCDPPESDARTLSSHVPPGVPKLQPAWGWLMPGLSQALFVTDI
jgi:hypothetical protein